MNASTALPMLPLTRYPHSPPPLLTKPPIDTPGPLQETGSIEGAKMVADFFRKLGDFESAVQFLVLSQANEEAFKMAQEHNQLGVYARVLESNGGTTDDYRRVASQLHTPRCCLVVSALFSDHARVCICVCMYVCVCVCVCADSCFPTSTITTIHMPFPTPATVARVV